MLVIKKECNKELMVIKRECNKELVINIRLICSKCPQSDDSKMVVTGKYKKSHSHFYSRHTMLRMVSSLGTKAQVGFKQRNNTTKQ